MRRSRRLRPSVPKTTRAQIESALQGVTRTGRTYPSLVAQTENTYTFKADVANGTNDVDLTIKLVAPTNAALFVAWSTCTNVPARTYYAKVPNQQLYVNATNAFLSEISYAVQAHTTETNRNGRTVYSFTQTTRWSATDARGGAWAMAYRGGDTVLFNVANTNEYIVIQNTTISDARRVALLGNYRASAAAAPPAASQGQPRRTQGPNTTADDAASTAAQSWRAATVSLCDKIAPLCPPKRGDARRPAT